MTAPTAAPATFPYLSHRTVAQVDADRARKLPAPHKERSA
jgi:hypothetical protein